MTPTPERSLGPSLEFLRGLWRLNHAMERLSAHMQRTLGVTAQQRLIIRCIGAAPDLRAGELANLLHVDPGTISAALRRLEDDGFVSRRPDPKDARRANLVLTRSGLGIDRSTGGTVERAVDRLLASTPGRQVASSEAVLAALTTFLDAERVDGSPATKGLARPPPRRPSAARGKPRAPARGPR